MFQICFDIFRESSNASECIQIHPKISVRIRTGPGRSVQIQKSENHFLQIGIEVFEGRVLLTGAVDSEQTRADAVGLAWKTNNVKAVLNEIMIGPNSISDAAKDAYITAQLTSRITLDKKIMAVNYSIETVASTVYLIGIAQNKLELEKVLGHARALGYVRKIISHVRIKKHTS